MSQSAGQYSHKKLDVAFALGKGAFGEEGTENTVTLTGLRVSVSVQKSGDVGFTEAQIRIFGMSLSEMNKLSTLGTPVSNSERRNFVAVSAGIDGGAMTVMFQGNINNAWVDANAAPEVAFIVMATDGGALALKPIPAGSYKGAVDVATVMAGLASQLGLTLENNGVSVMLNSPYQHGAARDQVRYTAEEAHINFMFEGVNASGGKLVIWPKDGTRGGVTALLSPETGLIGYPAYNEAGIVVKTLYNPAIQFGSRIEVKSELTPACGFWTPVSVTHDLESETPHGSWFTTLLLNTFGHVTARPR